LDEGYTYVSNYATIATVDIETLAERTVGSALHIRHVFAEKAIIVDHHCCYIILITKMVDVN